jgi:hypothetical protein
MRWRGLARPRRARQPMTRRPMRHLAATGYQAPRGFAGRPAPPHVPRVSPGIGPPSVVRDFLLPRQRIAQGVLRVITRFFWPSTGRVWLIHRAQQLIAACPQVDAQAYCRPPTMHCHWRLASAGASEQSWRDSLSERSTHVDITHASRRARRGMTTGSISSVTPGSGNDAWHMHRHCSCAAGSATLDVYLRDMAFLGAAEPR